LRLVTSLRACGAHVLLCQPLAVSCSLLIHNLAGNFIWRHSANRMRLNQLQILCHRPGMCGSTRHYPKRRLKNGSVHENLYHDSAPFHRYLTKNRRPFRAVITNTEVWGALCLLVRPLPLTKPSNQRNPRGHFKKRLAVDQIGHLKPLLIHGLWRAVVLIAQFGRKLRADPRARHLCRTAPSISGRFLDVIDDVILDGALLRLQLQPKLLL